MLCGDESMKSVIIATMLASPLHLKADDMSVSDFLLSKRNKATVEYVAGMGEGMDFLNHRAVRLGRTPLFCVPSRLRLNAANYMNIVEVEIVRDPVKNAGIMPLVSVMADGLIRTFPCT